MEGVHKAGLCRREEHPVDHVERGEPLGTVGRHAGEADRRPIARVEVVAERLLGGRDHLGAHGVEVGPGSHRELDLAHPRVHVVETGERGLVEHGVGDDVHVAQPRAKRGRAPGHVGDHSGGTADGDLIAGTHDAPHHEAEPADDVRDRVLQAERDGHRDNAEGGDEARGVHVEHRLHNREQGERPDERAQDVDEDRRVGHVGVLKDLITETDDDALDHEGEPHRHCDDDGLAEQGVELVDDFLLHVPP